jgi:hypothetical protein
MEGCKQRQQREQRVKDFMKALEICEKDRTNMVSSGSLEGEKKKKHEVPDARVRNVMRRDGSSVRIAETTQEGRPERRRESLIAVCCDALFVGDVLAYLSLPILSRRVSTARDLVPIIMTCRPDHMISRSKKSYFIF